MSQLKNLADELRAASNIRRENLIEKSTTAAGQLRYALNAGGYKAFTVRLPDSVYRDLESHREADPRQPSLNQVVIGLIIDGMYPK